MKHPESFPINAKWYTKLTNHFPLMIDDSYVQTYGIAWLFKENGKWVFTPRGTGQAHQYFNAVFFVRTNFEFIAWLMFQYDFFLLVHGWWMLTFPFFLTLTLCLFSFMPFAFFMHIRWIGKVFVYPKWVPYFGGMQEKQFLQFGLGWKNNGRFAIHFRPQTDASAAKGYHEGMPNTDQATGFNYGGH